MLLTFGTLLPIEMSNASTMDSNVSGLFMHYHQVITLQWVSTKQLLLSRLVMKSQWSAFQTQKLSL
jgi:hypothetical protein